ncbi:MAG: CDGSH iron-sulfur domain-containing protein [Spirochaetia bacterium]|nr:CDGSH iron-sulfur domain-containing protein [Spirochaetia bacterium]
MLKPKIFDKKSLKIEIAQGTHYWCQCGESKKQPFCDGSHKDTEFLPVQFEVIEKKIHSMCLCKQTKTTPYCDGTHKTL